MPYYCNYNGAGYLTAPTLGNLLTVNKIRVVIKQLRVVGDGFIFSQSGAGSAREFGVLYSGGSLNYIYGSSTERAILTTAEASSNFGSGGYFDLTFDNTANTAVLRNDAGGTIKSVSLVKGVSRLDGMLFRLGARCGNDTTDTSGGFIVANGTWIGDVAIYINDVLVRNYITPSGGTTIPDSVGGNDMTQRGTWPAGDGEWVFYSSGSSTPAQQPAVTISAVTNTTATASWTYGGSDQTGYEYRINGGAATATTATSLNLTGLTPNQTYQVEVRATNASGAGAWSSIAAFTTKTVPLGVVTLGSITKGQTTASVPFTYSSNDQTGFEYRVNGGAAQSIAASPVSLSGLTASTAYTVEVRAINTYGSGTWSSQGSFTTDAAGYPPAGTVTLGTVSKTSTTISVPFTYSASDQTGFQYRLNGAAPTSTTSPVSLSGLTPSTAYTVEVRAINGFGNGTWSALANITTNAPEVAPAGVPVMAISAVTNQGATVSWTYSGSDATSFEYRINGGVAQAGTSPLVLTGLAQGSTFSVEVRAKNAYGVGAWCAAQQFTVFRGVLASAVPSSGISGASCIYNDIQALGVSPTSYCACEFVTVPAVGAFTGYNNGAFEFSGAPDGVYEFQYKLLVNNAYVGDAKYVKLTIGA